ncbi:response regulator [bacterium]|nr:MAG: response regulator [bacterium]
MNLFDFTRVSSFPSKRLDDLREEDSLWAIQVNRRRAALFLEEDRASVEWSLRFTEYLFDTGAYTEACTQANRVRGMLTDASAPVTIARTLRVQCVSELMLGEFQKARSHIDQLEPVAESEGDHGFARGMLSYLEGFFVMHGDVETPDGPLLSARYMEDAIARFEACGEAEFGVVARIECAFAHTWRGEYITAIRAIQDTMDRVEARGYWEFVGRLLWAVASFAIDQGYRVGVEATLQKSLEWTGFSGDAWGRTQAIYALGKLHAYAMAPGDPSLASVPEAYFQEAIAEAEHYGMVQLIPRIHESLATMYEKCGEDDRSQEIVDRLRHLEEGNELPYGNAFLNVNSVVKNFGRRISSRLQDGIEDSPDAFFVFDARRDQSHRYVDYINEYRNDAGAKLFQLAPGSVFMFSEAQTHPCLEGLAKPLADAVEGRIDHQDICEIEADGESFWYRRRVVPSGDGAVLTLRDITAEHHIEEALRRAAYSAERADRAKSEFLANMSHEIRTPINGVLGLARLLSDTDLTLTQQAYVDDIIGSGDLLLSVIGDILDLSKIESSGMQIDRRPVDIGALVASTVRLYQGQAKEKGYPLTCRIDGSVPRTVLADGARIRQVLANLINNALKFTLSGSVTVEVETDGGTVVIEVCDTGIGIPEDRLSAIFDRFQQATPESRMFGGSGLGLTLSKGIVELMGGTIEAFSEVGLGSRFVIRLPLAATAESAAERKVDLPVDFKGCRVLLVDDNRVNTVVSKHALEKLGCSVALAANGIEALEAWEKEEFHLVLMDIRMPLLDGLEATRELRRREAVRDRRIPVVALTAGALLEERNECFEAGMDDYISKPFAGEALHEVLARWLA